MGGWGGLGLQTVRRGVYLEPLALPPPLVDPAPCLAGAAGSLEGGISGALASSCVPGPSGSVQVVEGGPGASLDRTPICPWGHKSQQGTSGGSCLVWFAF